MPSLIIRMTARDTAETHRGSTPLELLFDLTFVVAVAQVAARLAHSIANGHELESLGPYMMVFFAIWWAWMNFTWFGSAYDTDDVPYRALVLVQMVGVLIIAAGVTSSFSSHDFTAVIIGYAVMRVGLVSLWVRAGLQHPQGRATAFRYAAGISLVQVLWLGSLALPEQGPWWLFPLIAVVDLSVPLWAERAGTTAWHPHHIAERYGLFTIIVLGESVLAATTGVQRALDGGGLSAELVAISITGLVLLFMLWWLYFSQPAGEGLSGHRERSFIWGYGHFGISASLAALGAGLEVAVESAGHHLDASVTMIVIAIAIPVALFLVLLQAIHAPLVNRLVISPIATCVAAALVLLSPVAADALELVGALIAITLVVIALLSHTLWASHRTGRRHRI